MNFIAATEQGKNGWWRYGAGIATVLVFWLILGSLPVALAVVWTQVDGNPETTVNLETGMIEGVGPIWAYLIPNLTFPIFLLGIYVAVRLFHHRGLRTLVTPAPKVHWGRIWTGFWLWLLLAGIATGLEIALYPGEFRWGRPDVLTYAVFVILALVMTPLQTSTEELFFRGYLLQAIGRVIPPRVMVAALNGILFALPHGFNPEVSRGPVLLMLYYFGMGAFFSWVTLRDGTAELALGAHAANNLFVALLINFEGSALQTPALVMSTRFDPAYNLVTFVVMAVVFGVAVFWLGSPEDRARET